MKKGEVVELKMKDCCGTMGGTVTEKESKE